MHGATAAAILRANQKETGMDEARITAAEERIADLQREVDDLSQIVTRHVLAVFGKLQTGAAVRTAMQARHAAEHRQPSVQVEVLQPSDHTGFNKIVGSCHHFSQAFEVSVLRRARNVDSNLSSQSGK